MVYCWSCQVHVVLVRVTFWGSKASTLLNLQHVAPCINCEAFGKHHYCFGTFAMERHMANAWALKASKSMCASENGSAPMLMMFGWWYYFHYILVPTSVGFTVLLFYFLFGLPLSICITSYTLIMTLLNYHHVSIMSY